MSDGIPSLMEALQRAADLVQTAKHEAYARTARCASEADWDNEGYWRARSEGLADAEKILRGHAQEVGNAE